MDENTVQLVRDRAHRGAHHPAIVIGRPAQVLERQQPRHADRDVDDVISAVLDVAEQLS